MKRAIAVIVGVVMVCLVAYLSWLNPTAVEFRFTPARSVRAPLATLIVVAFLFGVVLVLAVVAIEAGRRALAAWRQGRQQRRSERIDDWEERGAQLVWAGDVQQGRSLLQRAWHRRPETAHAVLALARSYRDTGELPRARGLLSEAANHHQTNPDVLLALAEMHRAAGERTAAIEVLERLRALHPHAPRVLRALRDCYVAERRWREAAGLQEALLAELRDAEEAARERECLLGLRYQAAVTLADVPARVRALEALADSRAGSAPIVVSLGDALLAAGHADEASVLWERGLRATPQTVFVERLAALATEERHRDRLRTLLRKLRTDGVLADNVRLLTAQLYLADGRADDAAREIEAIQHPESAPALLAQLQAQIYRQRGQTEEALAAFSRAAARQPAYHCCACGRVAEEWVGCCPQCGRVDSYRAAVEIGAA
jgi:HemY protein